MAINLSGMISPETLARGASTISAPQFASQYEAIQKQRQDNQLLKMNIANAPAKAQQAANQDARLAAQNKRLESAESREQQKASFQLSGFAARGIVASEGDPAAMDRYIEQIPAGPMHDAARAAFDSGDFAGVIEGSKQVITALEGTQTDKNPTAANVQSTFIDQDGNLNIIQRSGNIVNTNMKPSENMQLVTLGNGSTVLIDTTGADAGKTTTAITAGTGLDAIRTGAFAKTEGEEDAKREAILPTAITQLMADKTANLPKEIQSLATSVRLMDEMLLSSEGIKQEIDHTTSGLIGNMLTYVGGTDAVALKGMLDMLRGNLAFDRLQEMRNASVSGGALGQVSNIELGLLESTVAQLNQNLAPEDLKIAIDKVFYHYNRARGAMLLDIQVAAGQLKQAQANSALDLGQFGPKIAMNDADLNSMIDVIGDDGRPTGEQELWIKNGDVYMTSQGQMITRGSEGGQAQGQAQGSGNTILNFEDWK